MNRTTWTSQYFYGNKLSEEEIEKGYISYRTLAKAFDAILVNDITKLFYATINGEYIEPEQINGYIDNSDEIEELQDQIEELEARQIDLINEDKEDTPEYQELQDQIDELQGQIDMLQEEQDEQHDDIYQYFIVSSNGASILQEFTSDPVFYIDFLDVYVWGVTHFGTSWDGVYTNIEIKIEE